MRHARLLLALALAITPAILPAEPVKPFPENRVRHWYRAQAQHFIAADSPPPLILPAFPGLDGGAWGHWGQNPETDNFDHSLNDVDTGPVLAAVVDHFGHRTHKAVCVRLTNPDTGDVATALFDPEKLTFTDAWRGDLVKWQARRYGITSSVTPDGERFASLDLTTAAWSIPDAVPTRFLGHHRRGDDTVFVYTIGDATVHDHIALRNAKLVHTRAIDGTLPAGVSFASPLEPVHDRPRVQRLLDAPNPPRWADKTVTTAGKLGEPIPGSPFVIDTLTVPYNTANPLNTPMRLGGVDFLPDGRAAVATIMGDVFLVSGLDDPGLAELTWTRVAAGLHQALGLVVKDGEIHVLGRDQITVLEDHNGDGETDYYRCLTNAYPTAAGNNFALTLHQDDAGSLYWFTRSAKYGMSRLRPGGAPESIATGLRGTNGTGVSPDGKIVFATAQEGDWTPASAIFEVGRGSYHGHSGPRDAHAPLGYEPPMVYIPRGVDNSCGDLTFLPKDDRLGPLSGQTIGGSFGTCDLYTVLREPLPAGAPAPSQGAVVPLPGEFLAGAHRSRYNPHDGCLYIAGSDGWQSYAAENGCLQRLRYTGGPMHLPTRIETRHNGLLVTFNTPVDPASLDPARAFAAQWNVLYSGAYGSAEYSVKHPGQTGRDRVTVTALRLQPDRRTVFFEIPQLHPVMMFHLYAELETAGGDPFHLDTYLTVHHLGEPFSAFAGYTPVEKQPHNPFPTPENAPRDPRLVAQEARGKTLADTEKIFVSAVAGLQFEPKQFTVRAGRRTAIVFKNDDPSMPHNLVVTTPDALRPVGEGSMRLAADPQGAARHYTIDHPGVLALSPVLQPGSTYAVYFDAPDEPGDYPVLCTFPGHWQITRATLTVTP